MNPYAEEFGLTDEQCKIKVKAREGHTEVVSYSILQAVECVRAYNELINPIRAVAKKFGYAVGLHGSLARDIDLIAVPWTEDAVEAELLAIGIQNIVKAFNKNSWTKIIRPQENEKPHGRQCWSIFVTGSTYIDLSVMPRQIKEVDSK